VVLITSDFIRTRAGMMQSSIFGEKLGHGAKCILPGKRAPRHP